MPDGEVQIKHSSHNASMTGNKDDLAPGRADTPVTGADVYTCVDINAAAFTTNIDAGVKDLTLGEWLPLGVCLPAVGLVLAGTRPRLAEYR